MFRPAAWPACTSCSRRAICSGCGSSLYFGIDVRPFWSSRPFKDSQSIWYQPGAGQGIALAGLEFLWAADRLRGPLGGGIKPADGGF